MKRRDVLKMAAGAGLLAACAPPAPVEKVASGPARRVFADTEKGLAVIDAADGATLRTYSGALPAPDWSRLYLTSPAGLLSVTAGDGRTVASVPGPTRPVRVVSGSGRAFALGDAPGGRPSTTITVVTAGTSREITLPGNIQPEAFSVDDNAMFVLEYLPPLAPDRYRVRMYDLRNNTVNPLNARDKSAVPPGKEETMRGEGRQAVLAPDRQRLYTLYTHQPDHLHTRDLIAGRKSNGQVHAFVHVLDLTGWWAYCLDLPLPFGVGPAQGHTIALADGTLFVYDATSGKLLQADTERLTVTKTVQIAGQAGQIASSARGDGRLYLAAGLSVQAVDTATLKTSRWPLPEPVRGVAVDGADLYVGQPGKILRLDAATGAERGRFTVPGIKQVRHAQTA
jgi:hypothetical protein